MNTEGAKASYRPMTKSQLRDAYLNEEANRWALQKKYTRACLLHGMAKICFLTGIAFWLTSFALCFLMFG